MTIGEEVAPIVRIIVGAALTVVGAHFSDETIKNVGLFIVAGQIGMEMPRLARRDPTARTRSTDGP